MAVVSRSDGLFQVYETSTTIGGGTSTIATLAVANREVTQWKVDLIMIENAANPRGGAFSYEFGTRWSSTNTAAFLGSVTTLFSGANGAPTITIATSTSNVTITVSSSDFNASWVAYVYAKKITI